MMADLDPATVQRELTEIWREFVDASEIAANDDFFDLGGDSMGAIHMLVKTTSRYDRDLDYNRFFGDPRLCTLVALVLAGSARGDATPHGTSR
jgi:hypothetical protein